MEDLSVEALESANEVLAQLQYLGDYFVRLSMPPRSSGEPNKVDFEPLKVLILKLRPELSTLLFFFKCVHTWSFLSDQIASLRPITFKIASLFTNLAEQFDQVGKTYPSPSPSPSHPFLWFLGRKEEVKDKLEYTSDRVMKLIDLLSGAFKSIEPLIEEVKVFFVEFNWSFRYRVRPPRHLAYEFPWVEFELNSIDCGSFTYLNRQISTLNWKLHELVSGFRKLQRFVEDYSEIEPLLERCHEVAVGAGMVFCQYCYTGKVLDARKAEFIDATFSRLQSRVDLCDSQFFDSCVRLLMERKNVAPFCNELLDILLGTTCPAVFLNNRTLYDDLKSLLSLFIWITPEKEEEEFMEGLKILSASVRKVILEAGALVEEPETDLFLEIWFLKMDIFLQGQLNSPTSLLLQHEIPLDSLKAWMKLVRPEKGETNPELVVGLEVEVISKVDALVDFAKKEKFEEDVTRIVLRGLLLKIVLFWAESVLLKVLNEDIRLTERASARHEINYLVQGFRFLSMSISHVLDDDKMQEIQATSKTAHLKVQFKRIEAVARRVVLLRHLPSVVFTEENEGLPLELVNEINTIRIQLKDNFVIDPMSKFPKTDGLGFINSLVTKLKELLPAGLSEYEKHLIQEILSSLINLTPLLHDMQEETIETHEYQELFALITYAAYETEYLIDCMMLRIGAQLSNMIRLYHLMEDIKVFHWQLMQLDESKTYKVKANQAAKDPSLTFSEVNPPTSEEPVLCLNDQEEEIIDCLIGGPSHREIVSVVGMPGIGKTTLARRVYNNLKVIYHFHLRAWCNVSQRYNKIFDKKRLLLEILCHIVGMSEKLAELPVEDLELKLHQQLLNKRYFIVLDDVWDSEAWYDLERSFPNAGNGSRILMTSRLADVSLKANPNSYCHPVRLMSIDESWNLLRMKIFHDEICSEELLIVGQEIASNCKGLPLAVVAIAGLLERIERTQESWKRIADSLSSMILDDPQTRCRDILELSYKHLPDHLKCCFLYFGAFLEQKDIPVSKLIYLWIAEGFVQKMGSNPLEDLGIAYLKDLMRRSLVISSAERSDGVVKTCRIHDLLRDMCLKKSNEENFFKSITRYAEADNSFTGLDYGEESYNHYPSQSVTYDVHRLCIFSKRKHFAMSRSSGPRVRSLLFFADSDMNPSCPYYLSFISKNFKLLKVLDLECVNVGSSFLDGIVSMVHLRYLGVCGNINSIPSSIQQLKNLETFLVKGLIGKVVLPPTIWYMGNLRHLHVKNQAVFSFENENTEGPVELDKLVSLSSPLIYYGEDLQKMITRLPNLQKLRSILLESQGQLEGQNTLKLHFPAKLQSLNMTYYGKAVDNVEFSFPINLKKLTLSNFRLPWSKISVIGRLQNLEVLKLLSRAFEGENWEMEDGEFCKLKFLKLESLNIAQWDASCDHLPNLEQLVLQRCELLEEVPESFMDIPTLKTIQLHWCSYSCEESVRKFEDIEGLKVVVNSDNISTS